MYVLIFKELYYIVGYGMTGDIFDLALFKLLATQRSLF